MGTKKRRIKYHPNINKCSDSIILKEALSESLEQIKESTQRSRNLFEHLAQIKKATQPSKEFLKTMEQIKESTQRSYILLKAIADADRIKKIIKNYEKD